MKTEKKDERLSRESQELLNATDEMGNSIRIAMENRDLDNRTLARLLDVGERAVSEWKNTGKVSRERIPSLAHILDVTTDWLLTGESWDDNIIDLRRINESKFGLKDQTIVFSPVMEAEDLFSEPSPKTPQKIRVVLDEFRANPRTRPVIPFMISNEAENIGTPEFFLQIISEQYKPFEYGDFIGFATDVSPMRGHFSIFLVQREKQWELTSGFYYPLNQRVTSETAGKTFTTPHDFILRTAQNEDNPDDVIIRKNDEIIYIGTVVMIHKWTLDVLTHQHTAILERQTRAHKGHVVNGEPKWGQ